MIRLYSVFFNMVPWQYTLKMLGYLFIYWVQPVGSFYWVIFNLFTQVLGIFLIVSLKNTKVFDMVVLLSVIYHGT